MRLQQFQSSRVKKTEFSKSKQDVDKIGCSTGTLLLIGINRRNIRREARAAVNPPRVISFLGDYYPVSAATVRVVATALIL